MRLFLSALTMSIDKTTLKGNVKKLCKEQGITLAQLADILGISYVSLWESLSGNPTLSRLLDIAEILNVPVGALVAGLKK